MKFRLAYMTLLASCFVSVAVSAAVGLPDMEDSEAGPEKKIIVDPQRDAESHYEQGSNTSPIQDQIFARVANQVMPMSPEQIIVLRELYNRNKQASQQAALIPPRPTASSKAVDLSPGATPPIIRMASGFITSLVFVDGTGQPWPVRAYDIGDSSSYTVMWDKGSTLMVQAVTEYKSGNLAVLLEGLATPIMVTLLPGQKAVDYRVDLQVPMMGPHAKITPSSVNTSDNPTLISILDGVTPPGTSQAMLSRTDAQLWISKNKKMYLRTRMTLLSPGWTASMTSADGTHAYEMPISPVILASNNGQTTSITLRRVNPYE